MPEVSSSTGCPLRHHAALGSRMCTAVVVSDRPIEQAFWSCEEMTIRVPLGLSLTAAIWQLRRILRDLGAAYADDLLCYCGEPIVLPATLMENPNGPTAK